MDIKCYPNSSEMQQKLEKAWQNEGLVTELQQEPRQHARPRKSQFIHVCPTSHSSEPHPTNVFQTQHLTVSFRPEPIHHHNLFNPLKLNRKIRPTPRSTLMIGTFIGQLRLKHAYILFQK